jgi:hypothetical protein
MARSTSKNRSGSLPGPLPHHRQQRAQHRRDGGVFFVDDSGGKM